MSLRRTGLARRAQLRRTPMPARKTTLAARRVATSSRRRDTGPTRGTRRIVAERAGYCCELCGLQLHNGISWVEAHSIHHRRPRGAGGSRDQATNTPANLLLVCGSATSPGCHQQVESRRIEAYANGWLVHQGTDPAAVAVRLWWSADPVFLSVEGTYLEQAA